MFVSTLTKERCLLWGLVSFQWFYIFSCWNLNSKVSILGECAVSIAKGLQLQKNLSLIHLISASSPRLQCEYSTFLASARGQELVTFLSRHRSSLCYPCLRLNHFLFSPYVQRLKLYPLNSTVTVISLLAGASSTGSVFWIYPPAPALGHIAVLAAPYTAVQRI